MESDDFTNHLRPSNQWSLQNQRQIWQERYFLDNFKNGLFNFEIIYHIKIEFKLGETKTNGKPCKILVGQNLHSLL